MKRVNKFYLLTIASGFLLICLSGCSKSSLKQVEVPGDVFTLQGEVMAIQVQGKAGRVFTHEIALDPLRQAIGKFDEVFLLHYQPDSVTELEYRWKADKVVADLIGGETYVIFPRPVGRFRDIYGVLCLLDHERFFIDRIDPNLYERLCPVILCAAELIRADELFTRFPEFQPISERLDFGELQIGGWEPQAGVDLCERCTRLKRPGRVYPDRRCFDTPRVPKDDDECKIIIFQDNFDEDARGGPPETSPSGDPADDALILQPPHDNIRVINSDPHGSQAVMIDRGSTSTTVLRCITGGGPHASGTYIVSFKAYSRYNDADTPPVTVSVKSSTGQTALRLIVDNGTYQLVTGVGSETLPGVYTVGRVDIFKIRIDMDGDKLSLNLNGTNVASDKPFLGPDFADLRELRFEHEPPALELYPAAYVVDDIKICK